MSDQHKVTVELGERAYEIHIGSGVLARAADYIAPVLARPKLAIVADANLAETHLPVLQARLMARALPMTAFSYRPARPAKTSINWLNYAIGYWLKKLNAMIALSHWAAGLSVT
jgi:3-dehydroquinate synthase